MNIVVYCEKINHYRFFRKFISGLTGNGFNTIFLTNRVSIFMLAIRDQNLCYLIKNPSRKISSFSNKSLDIYEVDRGILSSSQAEELINSVWEFSIRFFLKFTPAQLWIWNGSNLLRQTLSTVGKSLGIKTLFFEVGNFPGKIFVDPDGVNCRSRFTRMFNTIDRSAYDPDKFHLWRQHYLQAKLKSHQVTHAKLTTEFNWFYPLDVLGFSLLNTPSPEPIAPLRRTLDYLKSKSVQLEYDHFDYESGGKYLFFPLQVSTDSQLLWNSSIDNLKAIEIASARAEASGCQLVIKPHPAEGNLRFVKELSQMRRDNKFFFVNDNTFTIMKNAERVITINSTVGMEAMLLGKPVEILGRAIYENFSTDDLGFYIQCYLIDIDYTGRKDVSQDLVQKVLNRAIAFN